MNRRDTLHHPLARLFAANVDVTVVRIANKAMSSTLQLPVEFVEHEVAEQGRKWPSLRSSFHAWTDQSVLHHPGVQERPNEFQQPFVSDPFRDLTHQFVVIDSIEKFLQIQIHHPAVSRGDILLRLRYGLMRGPARTKTKTAIGERAGPTVSAEPA